MPSFSRCVSLDPDWHTVCPRSTPGHPRPSRRQLTHRLVCPALHVDLRQVLDWCARHIFCDWKDFISFDREPVNYSHKPSSAEHPQEPLLHRGAWTESTHNVPGGTTWQKGDELRKAAPSVWPAFGQPCRHVTTNVHSDFDRPVPCSHSFITPLPNTSTGTKMWESVRYQRVSTSLTDAQGLCLTV